jgi:hypothetical protein
MSEIDRLSNNGLLPALPIAEKHSSRGGGEHEPQPRRPPAGVRQETGQEHESTGGPEPKSTIDEYA